MFFFKKSSGIIKDINDLDNNIEKDKWKTKYLSLLDEQENTEKRHAQNQELLGKTIAHLSVAASGLDPQLEPYLQRIRGQIKQGIDYGQLKTELDGFTAVLNGLKDNISEIPETDKGIALLFTFLLQKYTLPDQQQALNQLHINYRPDGDIQNLFTAISRIIDEANQADSHSGQINGLTQSNQDALDHDLINQQLSRFLEQIEIPDELVREAAALKQQIKTDDKLIPLAQKLDNIAALLIQINNRNLSKLKEFDKFLAHVTEQLGDLGLTITDTGIALMDASLSRSSLDESVSEQISDLQTRSSNATHIEPLRQVISSHIAKITVEIQEHRQKEAIQREKYQRQLEELSQKIKMMEVETVELQSKLITANTNAQRDILTDLPNRLAYDERLTMEIGRWQRYHTPLCLVVWDIDFFKKVNDQYGHQVGDKVLVHIASLFANNIRKADFIARFGGEEFIMLLPHTNKHSALKVTEKLRSLIEQSHLEIQDQALSLTISCGITQFLKGDNHESAFERADQALYRAKEQGRNRCCMG